MGGATEKKEEAMAWRPVLEVYGRENGGNDDILLSGIAGITSPVAWAFGIDQVPTPRRQYIYIYA